MPLAERTALINPLTELLLAAAIRDTQSLAQQGLPLEIAVNLSAKSLYDPGFCKGLLALVHAAGFSGVAIDVRDHRDRDSSRIRRAPERSRRAARRRHSPRDGRLRLSGNRR
jgi:sensor c-di-GMP phosphodiesterase-like protein